MKDLDAAEWMNEHGFISKSSNMKFMLFAHYVVAMGTYTAAEKAPLTKHATIDEHKSMRQAAGAYSLKTFWHCSGKLHRLKLKNSFLKFYSQTSPRVFSKNCPVLHLLSLSFTVIVYCCLRFTLRKTCNMFVTC